MNSACSTIHSDLAQKTPSGSRIRHAMEGLDHYFNFEGTSVGKSWFEIKGSLEGSNALSAVRKAFWAEFDDSAELNSAAKHILPQPEDTFYISRTVQLLVIQSGDAKFVDELVDTRDCIVLIPRVISGSSKVTVKEPQGPLSKQKMMTVTFEVDSIYMIAGGCSISVPDETKLVCVMLCIWRGPR